MNQPPQQPGNPDFYGILGLDEFASSEKIVTAVKNLRAKYRPDATPNAELFKQASRFPFFSLKELVD